MLREQLGDRRLRLTDEQRRRLAVKAKGLGRKILSEVATIVTPETLLAVASKVDRREVRRQRQARPGRPRTADELESLVVRMAEENREWGYRRIQGCLSPITHRSSLLAVETKESSGKSNS